MITRACLTQSCTVTRTATDRLRAERLKREKTQHLKGYEPTNSRARELCSTSSPSFSKLQNSGKQRFLSSTELSLSFSTRSRSGRNFEPRLFRSENTAASFFSDSHRLEKKINISLFFKFYPHLDWRQFNITYTPRPRFPLPPLITRARYMARVTEPKLIGGFG